VPGVLKSEPDELDCGVIVWELAAGFDDLADRGVQRLDGVGRVDDPTDISWKGKEGNDLFPIAPPALRDGRILRAPFVVEGGELFFRRFGRFGAVDVNRRGILTPFEG